MLRFQRCSSAGALAHGITAVIVEHRTGHVTVVEEEKCGVDCLIGRSNLSGQGESAPLIEYGVPQGRISVAPQVTVDGARRQAVDPFGAKLHRKCPGQAFDRGIACRIGRVANRPNRGRT